MRRFTWLDCITDVSVVLHTFNMHHAGFTISVFFSSLDCFQFCLTLLGCLVRVEPSWHHSHQFLKQDISHFTCHNNFLLHFQFQMQLTLQLKSNSMEFSLRYGHFIIKEFLTLLCKLVCVLFGCLCGNLNLQGHEINWHLSWT